MMGQWGTGWVERREMRGWEGGVASGVGSGLPIAGKRGEKGREEEASMAGDTQMFCKRYNRKCHNHCKKSVHSRYSRMQH